MFIKNVIKDVGQHINKYCAYRNVHFELNAI